MHELVGQFLSQRKAEGLGDGTLDAHRRRLNQLLEFLGRRGHRRVTDVRPSHIDAYLASLKERGLKASTRLNHAGTVRCFFGWLAENGKVLNNPARHIVLKRPDEEELLEPPLEEEQVAAILDGLPRQNALDLRNILIVELLYSCGLRFSEALALNVRDCDLNNRLVHVRMGKGAKARTLPVMRGIYGALRDYLALRRSMLRGPDHGALLLNRRGSRLTKCGLQSFFRELNRRGLVERKLHPHLLRHYVPFLTMSSNPGMFTRSHRSAALSSEAPLSYPT